MRAADPVPSIDGSPAKAPFATFDGLLNHVLLGRSHLDVALCRRRDIRHLHWTLFLLDGFAELVPRCADPRRTRKIESFFRAPDPRFSAEPVLPLHQQPGQRLRETAPVAFSFTSSTTRRITAARCTSCSAKHTSRRHRSTCTAFSIPDETNPARTASRFSASAWLRARRKTPWPE